MKKFYALGVLVLALSACAGPRLESAYTLKNAPELPNLASPRGAQKAGSGPILLGGFSGLLWEGADPVTGHPRFLTHTDRGPNAPGPDKIPNSVVFSAPKFVPQWVRFTLDARSPTLKILEQIPLKNREGKPLSGLPNYPAQTKASLADEVPLDGAMRRLASDPNGLDLESIVRTPDGTYWMGEEYRPSICHFDASGRLLARYVPEGSNREGIIVGTEALPREYSNRKRNRGFEGLAYAGGKLYAFIQSPFKGQSVPVLEFDPKLKKTTGNYEYPMDLTGEDRKIGDALAVSDHEFLVLEQNSKRGKEADKKIYLYSIKNPNKRLILDLPALGYNQIEKAEGIAWADGGAEKPHRLAIISDNDFGLGSEPESTLVIFDLGSNWRGH